MKTIGFLVLFLMSCSERYARSVKEEINQQEKRIVSYIIEKYDICVSRAIQNKQFPRKDDSQVRITLFYEGLFYPTLKISSEVKNSKVVKGGGIVSCLSFIENDAREIDRRIRKEKYIHLAMKDGLMSIELSSFPISEVKISYDGKRFHPLRNYTNNLKNK